MSRILRFVAIALLMCWSMFAQAQDEFIISDIEVEGLQRIQPGTVFNYLPLRVGDRVTDTRVRESIKALFDTGFFRDVQIRRDGTVLVVEVQERPTIANIDFVGNKEFKSDVILEVMAQQDFAPGRVFNQSVLDQAEQQLTSQYFSRGKYAVDIQTTVTPLANNRVNVTFEIVEGEVAKIQEINIVGNENFSDRDLRKRFRLRTEYVLGVLTKRDRYSREQLSADLESLRSFYQDRGFLGFEITSTGVSITPDKESIFITVSVEEGERYSFKDFQITETTAFSSEQLRQLVSIQPGEPYSRRVVSESRALVADRLADEGYAFASVNAIPDIDHDNRTVAFTFAIDPGSRVYVRRINITGNIVTRDDVIRRELRQLEGSWFSAAKVKRSRIRLQRLDYFEDVNIETAPVPGVIDQVDLDIEVKEKPTGTFLFGIGYSDEEGLLVRGSVAQRNIFGTGKEFSVSVDNSEATDVISAAYIDPYHTENGVSRGFRVTRRTIDAGETNTADYIYESGSAGIFYQIPVSEFNAFNIGFAYEKVDLTSTDETPPEFVEFIDNNPDSDLYKLTSSFSKDTRDSVTYPTRGSIRDLSVEVAVPGSDLEYYKAVLGGSWYFPLTERFTFKTAAQFGYGDGYGDTDELPFFRNFYAGGPSSVRGYDSRSLGPVDSGLTPKPIGGSKRVLANAELLFPFPGSEQKRDKRLALFVDAGQVYAPDASTDLGELRYSTGLAFQWFSPIGPIAISYGIPLNDEPGDDTEAVQFSIGTFFR